jgi:hypothetical protein
VRPLHRSALLFLWRIAPHFVSDTKLFHDGLEKWIMEVVFASLSCWVNPPIFVVIFPVTFFSDSVLGLAVT